MIGPLGVGAVWAATYVGLGHGFRGSSFYRDPSSPFSTLGQGLLDLPLWLVDALGPSGVPAALLFPPHWARLAALPVAALFLWLLLPALKTRESRFFACAFGLSLAPLFSTLPTARVLIVPSFGALGWVASAIADARARSGARARWTGRSLLTVHLGLAALVFVPALGSTQSFANGTQRILRHVEPHKDVILVQAPIELLSNYALMVSTLPERAASAPRSIQHLYTGSSPLRVERVDSHTLELVVERGFGHVPIERVFCAKDDLPRVGSEVQLPAFKARVLESTPDGRPARVRFTFSTPLESSERVWLSWQDNHPVRWTPPALGKSAHIEPASFFASLR